MKVIIPILLALYMNGVTMVYVGLDTKRADLSEVQKIAVAISWPILIAISAQEIAVQKAFVTHGG